MLNISFASRSGSRSEIESVRKTSSSESCDCKAVEDQDNSFKEYMNSLSDKGRKKSAMSFLERNNAPKVKRLLI